MKREPEEGGAVHTTIRGALVACGVALAGSPALAEGVALLMPPGNAGLATAPEAVPTPKGTVDKELADRLYEIAHERPEELEAKIWEVLTTYISNPETVSMAVKMGSPLQTLTGRFPRIEVAMAGSVMKNLPIQRGFFVLKDVVLDLPKLFRENKFRFRDKGSTNFVFEISEEGINTLLREKGSKLKVKNAKMRLEYDHITFTGRMKVLFFNNHVTVHGRLRPRNGTEIHFNPYHLRLDFLPIPGFVLRMLRKKVNPIGDLKDFRFDVDIGGIETTKTRLMLASRGFEDYLQAEVAAEREGKTDTQAWPPRGLSQILSVEDDEIEPEFRQRVFLRRDGEVLGQLLPGAARRGPVSAAAARGEDSGPIVVPAAALVAPPPTDRPLPTALAPLPTRPPAKPPAGPAPPPAPVPAPVPAPPPGKEDLDVLLYAPGPGTPTPQVAPAPPRRVRPVATGPRRAEATGDPVAESALRLRPEDLDLDVLLYVTP